MSDLRLSDYSRRQRVIALSMMQARPEQHEIEEVCPVCTGLWNALCIMAGAGFVLLVAAWLVLT